ncbi:MAG TPA: FAD-dependent oxidoreductase [Ktedonobacteraceae bacterium]|nr:FAD-dependent oxidoreductase [Ktedonobacteraceae bacterium]
MSKQSRYLIIGNGIAGVTAAEILRREDPVCAITIIADDAFPVYYRPALKDYLGGHLSEEKLWARPTTFYRDQRIRFVPGRVEAINTGQQCVQLHNGQQVGYDKLLLANGAHPRTLSCPGLDLAGVSTLRTIADYQEILRRLEDAKRIVVYGSGTLALETAETLNHRGYRVSHLMRGETLWSEVLDPVASDLVLHEERRAGIDVYTGEEIAAITGKNRQVTGIVTSGGARIACDLVLIAIGIEPNTACIRASGIACGRGVKVNNGMCTSAAHVYAAGDVVEIADDSTGRTRVLGQWYPAIQQARMAAYNMLGVLTPDHPLYPGSNTRTGAALQNYYNATFLHGLDFVSIGQLAPPRSTQRYQEMIASPQPQTYRKVTLHDGRMLSALLLGDRTNALVYKRAIDHRVNLSPVISRLFSTDFALDAWLDEQGVPPLLLNVNKEEGSALQYVWEPAHVHTTMRLPAEAASSATAPDNDALLIPVPHPDVHVAVTEIQLNNGDQAGVITIGRQPGVSLFLDHRSVSRHHAEIACSNGTYLLRDSGSSNGTFVNGKAIPRDTLCTLHHHDRIRFGDVQFRFALRRRVLLSGQPDDAPSQTRFSHIQGSELHASASRMIPETILRSLDTTPTLVLVGKDTSPRVITLEHGKRYSIGRGQENDIGCNDTALSRKHAELFSAPDGFYIRDLASRYGVFVNTVKVNNAFHLSHADRIVMGNTLAYFSYAPGYTTGHSAIVVAGMTQDSHPVTLKAASMPVPRSIGKNSPTPVPVVAGLSHRSEVRSLDAERIQFEINMCIGCNRCMDACPVPVSAQVTIADLNHATIAQSVAPQIMQFTHECIMCGSCVPVCPVDNHRDLLMLSLKQRIGVSWNIAPDTARLTASLPPGWSPPLLVNRLREQTLLKSPQLVPDAYLLHIIAASSTRVLAPGEALLREGEYGRNLYLILDGYLELTTTDRDNVEFPVAILRQGEYVGEDGMLTGHPYRTSAYAQQPALVLSVPEQVMQRLMELVPQVRKHFDVSHAAFTLKSILNRISLFQGVADADMRVLVQQTPVKQYERGEQLFAEDDRGGRPSRETLHVLLEGFVKVARHALAGMGRQNGDERILAYRQQGDFFAGGLDLLGDGQAVTVTAINRCRVAEVPRSTLLTLFQRYPEVQQRFALRLREYAETAASVQGYSVLTGPLRDYSPVTSAADVHVQAGLHSLVNDGVVEGTEVLVIDLDKCIHCDECENACARRHGHSRMNRKGMVIGNISIATACRQCQNPVCMLCSRAGIARHPNGEVYITESCIGCGICAERCPYGAISIMGIEEEGELAHSTWHRFGEFFKGAGKERTRRTLPVLNGVRPASYAASGPLDVFQPGGYEEIRKKVAIKCDLCAGFSDQACVQACPTGAAIRIQPATFFGSTEEILRRRAN